MAVLQMQKICICSLKRDRKAVLELLQAAGVVEITQETLEDSVFKKTDTTASRQESDRNAQAAEQALEVLQEFCPEKTSLFSGLEGKELTEPEKMEQIHRNAEKLLDEARTVLTISRHIAELAAGISRLEGRIESLTPWLNLDIPLKCQDTGQTRILVGAVAAETTLEQLYETAAERAPEITGADIQIAGSDRDQVCITALCLKKDAEMLEEALRSVGFSRPAQQTEEPPAETVTLLRAEIDKLQEETKAQISLLQGYESRREDFRLLSDFWRIRSDEYEMMGQLLQSEKTMIVTGFCPAGETAGLESKLNSRFTIAFEAAPVPEDEEAPVLLSNKGFAASAEGVTASFGLPAKGEIDPTSIMAVCYIFLFGLMLSDAAYGLIVFLACFIAIHKFPRMGKNLKQSVKLFMYCGLSTLFWGVMFGGYFGDAVNIISRTFFGREIAVPALWFIPLNDPMKLLMYSLLFGLIHLFLGLGLKGYTLLKNGQKLDFFCDVVLWYMLLLGLIFTLLPTEFFSSIAQMEFHFPPVVTAAAKACAILGAVGIILMSGRSHKNPILRIALGAYDLYNITGWLSDILSYSRLLALGLATGVIASVINQMGSMMGNGIFGAILFIIIFCAGHLFNLAINLLGAYVHTCRLQYVEFFSKFYEGGGREFAPFRQNTKYVEIKED